MVSNCGQLKWLIKRMHIEVQIDMIHFDILFLVSSQNFYYVRSVF